MGMCTYMDILKVELYELLGDIDCVNTYINDVLVVSKDGFPKYIEHISFDFFRIYNAVLKVNVKNKALG